MPRSRKQPTERVNVPTRYVLTGRHNFPIDMLRYDSAWPAREEDSHEIARSLNEFTVDRDGHEVHIKMRGAPTVGRWNSFGWGIRGYYDDAGMYIQIVPPLI